MRTYKLKIQFSLIDFIKFNVKDVNVDNLEVNSLLDFKTILNTKTGEVGTYTIDDLINYDLINFKKDLLNLWNDFLYCDLNTIKETNYEHKYNNINWWEQLKKSNFKYRRNNLNKIIKSNPENIKNIISNLISQK